MISARFASLEGLSLHLSNHRWGMHCAFYGFTVQIIDRHTVMRALKAAAYLSLHANHPAVAG